MGVRHPEITRSPCDHLRQGEIGPGGASRCRGTLRTMAIGDDLLKRAKDFDRAAMEELLADVYPVVYRMAHALTGRPGAGRQVTHDVIRRSLRVLPKWRAGVVPENWFYHHTLLGSRQFRSHPPEARHDLLVAAAKKPADRKSTRLNSS